MIKKVNILLAVAFAAMLALKGMKALKNSHGGGGSLCLNWAGRSERVGAHQSEANQGDIGHEKQRIARIFWHFGRRCGMGVHGLRR